MQSIPAKKEKFWKKTPLADLDRDRWEALCDGCGKCCLNKLQDEETGDVFYTAVACRLLDIPSCRCRDYEHRREKAPDCLQLTCDRIKDLDWLPDTCAYRLVATGQDLPPWHHLVCGDRQAVHRAGMSVRQWALDPAGIAPDSLQEYIIVPALI